jgi:hypothetical protein
MQRRPSDVSMASGAASGAPEGQTSGEMPDPEAVPPDTAAAAQPIEGQQQPAVIPGLVPGQMYPLAPGSVPGQQPVVAPGTTVQPGFPAGFPMPLGQTGVQPVQPGGMTPSQSAQAAPTVPGLPGVPGQAPAGANPALDLIRRMLTTPNPRGLQGIPTAPTAQQPATPMLAGVASNLEAEGIKVYNDRSKYNEWEFLYDPRQDRAAMAAAQAAQQATPQSPTQQPTGDGGMTSPTGPGIPGFPGGQNPRGRGRGGMNMPQVPTMPRR